MKYITDVVTWLTGGGFTLLVALLVNNRKSIFSLLENIADHTKTKADNDLLTRIKAEAQTQVTAVQHSSYSGSEQKELAVKKLIELAKDFDVDLDSDKAKDYVEEAYQLNYGTKKPAIDKTSTDQTKLIQDITSTAQKIEAVNPPAVQLDNGDLIELNNQQYTINSNETGEITLTKKA
ncbi:hypothetical protein HC026_11180 [Lactobacillus sp. LC28-10]|uniref:Holin n=1 Tax=Secundilactobacillus angelensis TaxID=2722706 RepID=A0ABX1L1Y5_9LACO|nr:hypothetical protein [Secundilactobacillus angelensis]MCH5463186.1 hypothetical protein [Secundilactobacillus angelensis]NLR19455.1 hypothetical protein [Secundilactobacillus angelensis]